MAWDNNAERKEHTRESAEVTISLDKEELEKIAAFAELDVDTMSVEDLAEALHGIVAEMEAQQIPFASCHCVSNMVHSKNKIV